MLSGEVNTEISSRAEEAAKSSKCWMRERMCSPTWHGREGGRGGGQMTGQCLTAGGWDRWIERGGGREGGVDRGRGGSEVHLCDVRLREMVVIGSGRRIHAVWREGGREGGREGEG
jgi:hypothetical protein